MWCVYLCVEGFVNFRWSFQGRFTEEVMYKYRLEDLCQERGDTPHGFLGRDRSEQREGKGPEDSGFPAY